MKEIEFLPVWYKKNRRKYIGYKWQYVIISVLFVGMVMWSFIAGRIVSSTQADIQEKTALVDPTGEYEVIKKKMDILAEQNELIEKCSSRINVAFVLAELSFIVDDSVILKNLQLISEDYQSSSGLNKKAGAVVRRSMNQTQYDLERDIVYKVVLTGAAAKPEDVANLIVSLESSDYFTNIIPGFTRNIKLQEHLVSEFEIDCYIANFKSVN